MKLFPVRFSILAAALFLLSVNSGFSDTPVQPDELLKGFVHPPVNFSPGRESDSEARKYQGIPTIERAPGGRLWAAWYAGPIREDKFNYMVAATSADDGKTWSDLKLVVDPDGTGSLRASDPCFWLDPNGKLWLFWWMNGTFNGNPITVTMSISTENPDAENPVWTEPRALFPGVMLNKPIVTSIGEWLMPAAIWHRENSCRMMVSKDSGKTWALRGTANVPEARRQCDEPMVVERKDGSLWQLVRTAKYGLGETVSTDGGRTWTEVKDYLHDATSRFHLRKLQSGNLLLIKHGPLDQRIGRKELTAYLSTDDGATWKGGLLIDERSTVSYPDATQAPDGTIYAIYDWNRADEKNILMTTFTEEDVLAGAYVGDKARSKVLINHATGINPKPWLKKQAPAANLRSNADGAPLKTGPATGLSLAEGSFQTLENGARIFTDRSYTFYNPPAVLSGQSFVLCSIDHTEAVCLEPGMVYVLTPLKDRNPDSVEDELLALGFEKTSVPEFFLFLIKGKTRLGNACSVFQKQVKAGEKIQFGKWGVLVCPATTLKPSPAVVRVACIGDSITFGVGIQDRINDSYPAQLAVLLGKKYRVENFGVSGATLLKKGDRPYWKTEPFKEAHDFAPGVVVIMLGTNDVKPVNRVHFGDFVADYIELIKSFQCLESAPVVRICYPVPAYRQGGEITDDVLTEQVMPMIDEVARQTGVEIIDLHATLGNKKELFPKGIHPNEAGAGLIAETVFNTIFERE